MSNPVRASDRDLRALAAVVSEDRTDLPDGEGCRPPCWPRSAAAPCPSTAGTLGGRCAGSARESGI